MFEKAGQRYSRCTDCGLQSAVCESFNANLSQELEDYEPAYRQYLEERGTDRQNIDAVIRWLERYIKLSADVRLLDVGAGSGKFLRRLSETRGCSGGGLEPSDALFHGYGLDALGVVPLPLPDFAAAHPSEFDVVTALDVIEHVPDAKEFVRSLHRVVKPGGFVFLSTPDTTGPLARLLGRRWHHYNAYHFALYNAKTLAMAASAHGFLTVESSHHAKSMNLGYVWNYASDFLLRGRLGGISESRFSVSVNLHDILSVVWQKPDRSRL